MISCTALPTAAKTFFALNEWQCRQFYLDSKFHSLFHSKQEKRNEQSANPVLTLIELSVSVNEGKKEIEYNCFKICCCFNSNLWHLGMRRCKIFNHFVFKSNKCS